MATTARGRFGAAPSSRMPRYTRGETVEVWFDFVDENGAPVDVAGVTCVVWWPGGAERTPALTPVEETAGTWRVDIPATLYSGLWKVAVSAASPDVSTDTKWFRVTAPEPDEGPPPEPSWTAIAEEVEAIRRDAEAAVVEAQAAQVAAEAALALAQAAQAAAESAVSTGTGPLYATSVVAATLDGNGRCTNYTCVLPRTLQAGSVVKIKLPTRSGTPGVTIRPTVNSVLQSFYALREPDGTQIVDGYLPPDVMLSFVYNGTVLCYEGPEIAEEIVRPTGYQRNYRAPGDAHPRHRDYPLADGRRFWYTGDGTDDPEIRLGILEDGSVRAYAGFRVDGPATVGTARILTDNDAGSPLTAPNIKHIVGAPSRMNNRTAPQRVSVGAGGYIQPGGLEQHAPVIYGNGAWIDFQHMPKGGEIVVMPASSGAVPYLYTGEGEWGGNGVDAATLTPNSWVNTGTKLLVGSAGAWLTVKRNSGGGFLARVDNAGGSVADGTGATMPAHDLVVGWLNQSWIVDIMQNGGRGARERLAAMGLPTNYYSVDSAPVGGSSLLYFAEKSTLFLWDQRTDTPGRRLLDIVAASQADQASRTALRGSAATAISVMVMAEGLNGMGYFGPSSTHPDNCPQKVTASIVKMCQYIDAQLGANLLYIIVPLTSQKEGTFPPAGMLNGWHAMRMAQLRAPAAGAAASPPVNIIIAPEIYGDPRSGDEEAESGERHYDFPAHAVQMGRVIDAWANEVEGEEQDLGPVTRPTDPVVTADGGAGVVWDVILDYGEGRTFSNQAVPHLGGFRMLPEATGDIDDDDFATPLEIASVEWAGAGGAPLIALRVTLAEAYTAGTPRPSVLWGAASQTDDLGTLVYTVQPSSAKRMYWRQFLSGG